MLTHGKTWNTLRGLVAGSLLLGSAAFAAPAVFAQDDDDQYGAYVYSGTLDALDDARAVEDIGELEDDDDRVEHWERLGAGQEMPDELYTEDDDLDDDVTMDTLLNEPHLIVVHETEDTDSPIIAIGVIEGELDADDSLLIQLEEHEGSGWEGRAWLGPDDDDDDDEDEVDTIVGIYPAGAVEPLGTPEATATS